MGWSRPHKDVTVERLVYWYLFHKAFHVTIEQLIDMAMILRKPAIIRNAEKSKQFSELKAFVLAEIWKREHPVCAAAGMKGPGHAQ